MAALKLEDTITTSRTLGEGTKKQYIYHLMQWTPFLDLASCFVRADVEAAIQKQVKKGVRPTVINQRLSALRFAAHRRALLMPNCPDATLGIERLQTPDTELMRTPRSLTAEEAARLLATTAGDDTWMNRRDRALLLIGLRMGLRRTEIAGLAWSQFDGKVLSLIGKGRKPAKLSVDSTTREALASWKEWARPKNPTGPIFIRQQPSVLNQPVALTSDGVYYIVKERARQAEIDNLHPHIMRHTCASLLLAARVPAWQVAKFMRHSNVNTTLRYAHDLEDGAAIENAFDETFK